MAIRRVRPVRRVILKPASLASVPELVKNTRASRPGAFTVTKPASRSASAIWVGVAKKLRHVAQGRQLRRDRTQHLRVGVAEGVDGEPGQQVEVAVAVGVPQVDTLAPDEHPLRRPEGVHQRVAVAVR